MRQRLRKQFNPRPRNNTIGALGETLAVSFLRSKGYRLLTRNFRMRYGEIDIIMRDRTETVFVEVKTRTSSAYGPPESAITARKLREIVTTADYYLMTHPGANGGYRIDVVAVVIDPATRKTRTITHYPNVTL